jgi:hypothetical protein
MATKTKKLSFVHLFFFLAFIILFITTSGLDVRTDTLFTKASENSVLANEGFYRSQWLLEDWMAHRDPGTGLIPRNLWERGDQSDIWDPKDAAADNFPFLYITSYFTNPDMFEGEMTDMLITETALTSRLGRIPDEYSFRKNDFLHEDMNLRRIIFGAAEYVKDGLITMTELLGAGPWKSRMTGIIDDIIHYIPDGPVLFDNDIVNMEINGELLQVLSRVYWLSGDEKYLNYAIQTGDYYLLGNHHPTRDFNRLRLRDHGGEIVAGLAELYATLRHVRPEKADAYKNPLYEMLDRVLEAGTNEAGLLYNEINPQTGEVLDDRLADTWGYVLNGHYTVYKVDGNESYRDAIITALRNIIDIQDYVWESESADGDADVIEGVMYLYNHEPVAEASRWMDRQIQIMWAKQDFARGREYPEGKWRGRGVVEGWHGDGNFARTSLMYSLWKTQGTYIRPWHRDILLGGVQEEDVLYLTLAAGVAWKGKLIFDHQRHRNHLNLPLDWPRINQYSEWFTVEQGNRYLVENMSNGTSREYSGDELRDGIWLNLEADEEQRLVVRSLSAGNKL